MVESTALIGMKDIAKYVWRSNTTVLDWIRTKGFPAKKENSIWMSDRILVDDWRRDRIRNEKGLGSEKLVDPWKTNKRKTKKKRQGGRKSKGKS